jgi:hypothetical protein
LSNNLNKSLWPSVGAYLNFVNRISEGLAIFFVPYYLKNQI